ncbi:MAG: GNAT family N-acetyltransferase [Sphingomicrobium sp.]
MSAAAEAVRAARANGDPVAAFVLDDGREAQVRAAYPLDARRGDDIRFFAELRRKHADSFFDTGRPSEEEVAAWVRERYDCDGSQINLIVEADRPLLFFGLSDIEFEAGQAEFGRLMRQPWAPPGLAAAAMKALFGWAREIGLRTIALEVFADNEPALRAYRRLGFELDHQSRRLPKEEGGRTIWERGEGPGDRPVLAMRLDLEHAA